MLAPEDPTFFCPLNYPTILHCTRWTDCKAIGMTRQAALARLKHLLSQQISHQHQPDQPVTVLEIELPHPTHPWLSLANTLKHNPLFEQITTEIELARQEEQSAYLHQLDQEAESNSAQQDDVA